MRMPTPATTKARIGAMTAGIATFSMMPSPITASAPSAAKAAPTTPPISACEEDDGRPKYHVRRFQKIAPINPAKTIASVIWSASTMPLAIVAATCSDRNAPTKFRTAASATTIQRTTSLSMVQPVPGSGVLDDDALEDVRRRLAGVDGVLEAFEDVLPADHEHRIDALLEQPGERLAHHAVALVLEPVDL